MSGMHPRRGRIIRPALDCRRGELRSFLEDRGLPFVHDESNDDVSIPRNRVRAELLPLLERRFNPSIVDVLADEAALARDEWQWIEAALRDAAAAVVTRPSGDVWEIDLEGVARLPLALARAVVRDALVQASGGRPISFRHVEEAQRLTGSADAPGLRMERRGQALVLTTRGAAKDCANLFR